MNVCTFVGRLTSDVELKTTTSGVSVASFNVAVDRAYKQKGQERQTDFIPCVAWRSTAEFISKHFRKGQRIAVKGELQSRQYTANDGNQRKVLEVIVENAFFCESKNEPSLEMAAAMNSNQFEEVISDEDLPF